ncbi:hypothetical protein ZWY2020_048713 [Hordeum vulgare]|nr:hypothetical protein ZWY2020_048713 [Hordeum vulgare]
METRRRTREAEAGELDNGGAQVALHAGAEELRVLGDEGGDVGAGEAEAGEEGEHNVGLGRTDPLRQSNEEWEDLRRRGGGGAGRRSPAASTAAADGGENGLVQTRSKEEEAEEGGLA